jgi:hypothetical protein
MDSRLPAGWQVRPQDSQQPYQSPQTSNYSHLPLGPSLAAVVASNDQTPSFAHNNHAINCGPALLHLYERTNQPALDIQHILARGQFPQYLHQTEEGTIKAIVAKCCEESRTFIDKQYQAVQGDVSILTAYDDEIHDLELELMADEAQEVSAISPAASYHVEGAAHGIKKAILNVMKSRAALLQQDYRIRMDLVQIEASIHRFVPIMMPLQIRVKYNKIAGVREEQFTKEKLYEVVRELLPLKDMRDQKRAELQRCRETRAVLEQELRDMKERLQVQMAVKNGLE